MADVLSELGVRLRQRLLEKYGTELEVVVARAGESRPPGPHLLLEHATDPHGGQPLHHRGTLVGFVPPGGGAPLAVSLEVVEDARSGQLEAWEASVEGAPEEQRTSWRDFFQPRTWPVALGASARCYFRFNGGPKLDF